MNKLIFTLLLLITAPVIGKDLPIKLTGNIEISIEQGVLAAEFKLSHIPDVKNYLIHLNSGLNVQYFRSPEPAVNYSLSKSYNPTYSEESFAYVLMDDKDNPVSLPDSIEFKYTGKFPVIKNLDEASDYGDWKGNIAFNGKTIRTDGFQTAWYPIIYDIKQDKRHDQVAYDIKVRCTDCKSIYLNGSKPVTGNTANFKRSKPVTLSLFAGEFDIGQFQQSYYLNSKLTTQEMSELGKLTSSFKQYFQANLSLPYGENVVYIHTTPVSKHDSWLFVAYPSIVLINHNKGGLSELISTPDAHLYHTFIAHELAHYYFGTYRSFNSELGDALTESFAEYLALSASKNLISESSYWQRVNRKFKNLENVSLKPLKNIKKAVDYGDRDLYVYVYAPIIWLAIADEIGEQRMWQWLKLLLTTQTTYTNYEFILHTLAQVVKDESQLNAIIQRYFTSTKAIDNAKARLQDKS